jgi:hypothetical protein
MRAAVRQHRDRARVAEARASLACPVASRRIVLRRYIAGRGQMSTFVTRFDKHLRHTLLVHAATQIGFV